MNDTTRPSPFSPEDPRFRERLDPTVSSRPPLVAGPPGTPERLRPRLLSGWFDRLNAAAAAGLIVVSPRSALLVAGVLGSPLERPSSTSPSRAAETRTADDGRTAS